MAGNSITSVAAATAQTAAGFEEDATSPELVEFDFSMDGNGFLALTFTEIMKASSINVNQIFIQDALTSTVAVPLETSTFDASSAADSTVLTIAFTKDDRNAIKAAGLANSEARSWIRFTADAFADMNDQPVVIRTDGNAEQAENWYGDATAPSLDSFDLNMANNRLTMFFSEPIDFAHPTSPFAPGAITLQKAQGSNPASDYTLTTSSAVALSAMSVQVTLSKVDVDNLKYKGWTAGGVVLDKVTTFVSISPELVMDTSFNQIDAVAIQVDEFLGDNVPGEISVYSMDMRTGTIELTWDEPTVRSTQVLPSFILANPAGTSHTFVVESETQGSLALTHTFKLAKADLDEVKRLKLCDVDISCILTTPASWVMDTASVAFPSTTTSASTFQEDDIAPTVDSVSEFNAHARTVTVVFSETVDADLFGAEKVFFSSSNVAGETDASTVQLQNGDALTSSGVSLTFKIIDDDYNLISADDELCTKLSNCYFHIANSGIVDMYGNPIQTVTRVNSFAPAARVKDEIPPNLVEWSLDMGQGLIGLTFDEPIRPTTLKPRGLTIQNAGLAVYSHALDEGDSESPNGLSMVIQLSAEDIFALKSSNPPFAKSHADSWLTINSIT
eukprot:gene27027-13186_t